MPVIQQVTAHSSQARTWTSPTAIANDTNPFVNVIAQYPILKVLVSHLQPDDLVIASLLSQATHSLLRMHDANAKASLLAKTLCPGRGLEMRMKIHCSCVATGFTSSIGCAGMTGFNAKSCPCHGCGINTCDECRIHVLYQVFTEDPGIDMHRWWGGYLFLVPQAVAIYPPKNEDDTPWHVAADEMMPLHDQGRFHIPLHIMAIADPEPIDRVMDLNLGTHIITPHGRTKFPYSGLRVVSHLYGITEARKEHLCVTCFEKDQAQRLPPCSCTLRNRFLNRWLCVPCYIKEHASDAAIADRNEVEDDGDHQHIVSRACRCGAVLPFETELRAICNWCKGAVGDVIAEDSNNSEETASCDSNKNDEDEDHSADDFGDTPADVFCFAKNRDGSITVYVDGHRIRGHRLSRGMVAGWLITQGVEQPCTPCHCGDHDDAHDHSEPDEGLARREDVEVGEGDIPDLHSAD